MTIKGKVLWSVNKFSQLILEGKVWISVWRICMWIYWDLKGQLWLTYRLHFDHPLIWLYLNVNFNPNACSFMWFWCILYYWAACGKAQSNFNSMLDVWPTRHWMSCLYSVMSTCVVLSFGSNTVYFVTFQVLLE